MSAPDVPHNYEMEQAALGGMIMHTYLIGEAVADVGLRPEMFHHPAHRSICTEILALNEERNGLVDPMMVANRLKNRGIYDDIGGMDTLMAMTDLAPVAGSVRPYFNEIRNLHLRRQVIQASRELITDAYDADSGSDVVMGAPQRFYDLIPKATEDQKTVEECLRESVQVWRDIENGKRQLPGLSTGIEYIDRVMGGLKPGYHIIAARPSAGKTSLAGQIAEHFSREGRPSAWVNMDMPRGDLYERNVARASGVSLPKLSSGHAGEKNFAQVESAIEEMRDWPQHFLHAEFDVAKICSWVRLMKMRHDIQLLVIDYIQKCRAPHINSYDPVRVISYSSAAIKELCQQIDIPVLVLAQLNRGNIRDNRPPTLADLKGCGDLEQDAQSCVMLYKEEKFPYDKVPASDNIREASHRAIWLDIGKNQNGGIGAQEFWLRGSYFMMHEARPYWGYEELFQ